MTKTAISAIQLNGVTLMKKINLEAKKIANLNCLAATKQR